MSDVRTFHDPYTRSLHIQLECVDDLIAIARQLGYADQEERLKQGTRESVAIPLVALDRDRKQVIQDLSEVIPEVAWGRKLRNGLGY